MCIAFCRANFKLVAFGGAESGQYSVARDIRAH